MNNTSPKILLYYWLREASGDTSWSGGGMESKSLQMNNNGRFSDHHGKNGVAYAKTLNMFVEFSFITRYRRKLHHNIQQSTSFPIFPKTLVIITRMEASSYRLPEIGVTNQKANSIHSKFRRIASTYFGTLKLNITIFISNSSLFQHRNCIT